VLDPKAEAPWTSSLPLRRGAKSLPSHSVRALAARCRVSSTPRRHRPSPLAGGTGQQHGGAVSLPLPAICWRCALASAGLGARNRSCSLKSCSDRGREHGLRLQGRQRRWQAATASVQLQPVAARALFLVLEQNPNAAPLPAQRLLSMASSRSLLQARPSGGFRGGLLQSWRAAPPGSPALIEGLAAPVRRRRGGGSRPAPAVELGSSSRWIGWHGRHGFGQGLPQTKVGPLPLAEFKILPDPRRLHPFPRPQAEAA